MELLHEVADKIVDKCVAMEEMGIRPGFVIIGKKEYDAVIASLKTDLSISKDGMMVFGVPVVPDLSSPSRTDAVPAVGLVAHRQMERKGLLK